MGTGNRERVCGQGDGEYTHVSKQYRPHIDTEKPLHSLAIAGSEEHCSGLGSRESSFNRMYISYARYR